MVISGQVLKLDRLLALLFRRHQNMAAFIWSASDSMIGGPRPDRSACHRVGKCKSAIWASTMRAARAACMRISCRSAKIEPADGTVLGSFG